LSSKEREIDHTFETAALVDLPQERHFAVREIVFRKRVPKTCRDRQMTDQKFPFPRRACRIGRKLFLLVEDALPFFTFVIPQKALREVMPPKSVLERGTCRIRQFHTSVSELLSRRRFFGGQSARIELSHK